MVAGTNIDVFHKDPRFQRRLLADPRNLPHNARIVLGAEVLDLAIYSLPGIGTGGGGRALLVWNVATALVAKNRETARLRLIRILRDALAPPPATRRPSRPTRGSIERRLAGKKARSAVKATRSSRSHRSEDQ